jgi:ATP-dependent DNA ligase
MTCLDFGYVEHLKQDAKKLKIEGFVVKDTPKGKCWKIKPTKTVDAFVTGYEISDSDSFAGGLKAVKISVYDSNGKAVEIASCGSGFFADYRMSVDPKTLIGRVGEFSYQCLAAKGRLKFPSFLRWRDDEKTADQCTMEQLK